MSIRHEVAVHGRPTAKTVDLRQQDRGENDAESEVEDVAVVAGSPEEELSAEVRDPRE